MADGIQRLTNLTTGGPVHVDVKDGKIVRIIPLELDPSDGPSWTIKARGRDFTPPRKTTLSNWTVAHKSTIYSPKRILTPLKRVDFDPKGDRNLQNRGESGYEPISWDEALDLVAEEMIRLKREYGPAAMMTTPLVAPLWGNVGYRFSAYNRFMNLWGMTYVEHNPDSWEGWQWGGDHMWGFSTRLGIPEQYDLLEDALKHCEMMVFWSSDPETTCGVYGAHESTSRRQWLKELGVKMVFIDPYFNHTAGLVADKWLAPRMGTDVALGLGIAFVWLTEGLYDKEYVATHTHGFDEWKRYVLGESDGVPKTPEWAERETLIPAREIRALAREWARQEDHARRRRHGRLGRRLPLLLRRRVRPHDDRPGRHAGPGQARQQHLLDHRRSARRPRLLVPRLLRGRHLRRHRRHRGRLPPVLAHVAQRGRHLQPAAQRRGADRLPPAHPRDHEPRAGGVAQQGLLRRLHRDAVQEVPVPGLRLSARADVLPVRRLVHRHHDRDQPLRARPTGRARCPSWSTRPSGSRARPRFADIILPACTNFERWDIGDWAHPSGYGTHKFDQVNHRLIVLQKKCIEPLGESKSDYEIFALLADRLGFGDKYTEGGHTDLDWVKRVFHASDLPSRISWEEFEKKGYYVVPVPEDQEPTPALRWFAEDRPKDTPDWGPPPWDQIGGKGLQTQSGKIEFVANSLKRFYATDGADPERPVMGPQYLESWEGHHTKELFEKYPLAMVSPHPRFTFHTVGDAKECWSNEIKDHRVLVDGHYYWIMRLQRQGRRGARHQRTATWSGPTTTGPRSSWPRR